MNTKLKRKRILIFLIILVLIISSLLPYTAFATEIPKKEEPKTNIDNYDVKCVINKNRTYDVTETADVTSEEDDLDFYKYIDLTAGEYYRVPSSKKDYDKSVPVDGRVHVTDIKSNTKNKIEEGDSFSKSELKIRLSDPNKLDRENKTRHFETSYKVHTDARYERDDFDYVFFKVEPAYFNVNYDKLHMIVEFPKTVDHGQIDIKTSHMIDSIDSNLYKIYDKNGKTYLDVNIKDADKHTDFIVLASMPKGYFDPIPYRGTEFAKTWLACSAIFFVISILAWLIAKKSGKTTKTESYYPPNNISPTSMASVLDSYHTADETSNVIVGTITYLANKGYLTIEKTKDDYVLTKIDRPIDPSLDDASAKTLDRIFLFKNTINLSEISKNTWICLNEDVKTYAKAQSDDTPSDPKIYTLTIITLIALVASSIVAIASPWYKTFVNEDVRFYSVAAFIVVIVAQIFLKRLFKSKKDKITKKRTTIIVLSAFLAMLLFNVISACMYSQPHQHIYYAISIVFCLSAGSIFRTKLYGINRASAEFTGQVEGFKDFITSPNPSKLSELSAENPNYVFAILPYSFITNSHKEWLDIVKEYKDITPTWCKDEEDSYTFNGFAETLLSFTKDASEYIKKYNPLM